MSHAQDKKTSIEQLQNASDIIQLIVFFGIVALVLILTPLSGGQFMQLVVPIVIWVCTGSTLLQLGLLLWRHHLASTSS